MLPVWTYDDTVGRNQAVSAAICNAGRFSVLLMCGGELAK